MLYCAEVERGGGILIGTMMYFLLNKRSIKEQSCSILVHGVKFYEWGKRGVVFHPL
ncbi:hypothetical protein MACH16_18900 [Marinomonas pontica]|uniref:Uncharacterized protein n=1 Tax=Marinomonas pontica TaxID=264739 RepID=A0ABM8FDJ8_9GAMM|nr:hypothetical protein MACH16_18900 [Marinomonas pontica]